jgi:hypothetical protein
VRSGGFFVWAVWLVSPRGSLPSKPRRARSSTAHQTNPATDKRGNYGVSTTMELSDTATLVNAVGRGDVGTVIRRPKPTTCRRRRWIGLATWSAVGAFISRERSCLMETAPDSPRIRPTLPRLHWMEPEPGMARTETRRAS